MTTGTSKFEPLKPVPLLERIAQRWTSARPQFFALLIGLIAGPVISSFAGWQVTSGTARAQLESGLLEQKASFCEARARVEVRDTSKLDWDGRRSLAAKWAIMPGSMMADSDVVSACSWKLI